MSISKVEMISLAVLFKNTAMAVLESDNETMSMLVHYIQYLNKRAFTYDARCSRSCTLLGD